MKIGNKLYYYLIQVLILGFFNYFVLFESKINYLEPYLIFGFLLYIPGLFIWNLIQSNKEITWNNITYSVGLSISSLMLFGLLINIILPKFEIADALSKQNLLLLINVEMSVLLIANFIKDIFSKEKIFVDKLIINIGAGNRYLTYFFYVVVSSLPFLALIGTSLLNNGQSNFYIFLNLIIIFIYILLLGILHKHLNRSIYPYSIFMIGLTVLLNISLRSWHINGTDILTEYRMFQQTYQNSFWSIEIERHAYNACISITILPTIFQKLTGINGEYIFKLLFQIIFAFVPVTVYLFCKKFLNEIYAFLAGILFISFPIYVTSMAMHIRQEIAFLFFNLIILSLFNDSIDKKSRFFVLIVFGFSMIISHYSTTYLTLVLFLIWYCFSLFLYLILLKFPKIKKHLVKTRLPFWYLIVMFLLSFYWYVFVVNIASNVTNLGKKVITNLSHTFSNDVRVDQTSLLNQFNIFYKQPDSKDLLTGYIESKIESKEENSKLYFPQDSYKNYYPVTINSEFLKLNTSVEFYKYSSLIMEIIKKLQKLFTFIGFTYVFLVFINYFTKISFIKKINLDTDLFLSVFSSITLLVIFTIIPYVTINYDLLRMTQQLLVILAYTVIIGILFLLSNFKYNFSKIILCTIFVALYFGTYSHLFNQLIGGAQPSIQLNNYGAPYERFIITSAEIKSAQWLEKNRERNSLTHADPDSILKINMATRSIINTVGTLLPSNIYLYSYIYLNKVNVRQSISYSGFQGELLRFTIPLWFYGEKKDLIYNSGDSQIYF